MHSYFAIPASRWATIFATICSTAGLLAVIVLLPLLHMRIQKSTSLMLSQIELCKLQSRDIWKQLSASPTTERFTRRAGHTQGAFAIQHPFLRACCACVQGPPGPRGPPGQPGEDGLDGDFGEDGPPGRDGEYLPAPRLAEYACQKCPPGPPGPPGFPGPKGRRGKPGKHGEAGEKGEDSRPGPPGPVGVRGEPGPPGPKGTTGDRGKVLNGAPQGRVGPIGPVGPRGKPGGRGHDGKPGLPGVQGIRGNVGDRGAPGNPGLPGPPGTPGEPGLPGSCSHCPGHMPRPIKSVQDKPEVSDEKFRSKNSLKTVHESYRSQEYSDEMVAEQGSISNSKQPKKDERIGVSPHFFQQTEVEPSLSEKESDGEEYDGRSVA